MVAALPGFCYIFLHHTTCGPLRNVRSTIGAAAAAVASAMLRRFGRRFDSIRFDSAAAAGGTIAAHARDDNRTTQIRVVPDPTQASLLLTGPGC